MADIASNLVAHWNLNETSGTSAADSSGNGYTGTYQGSPTLNGTTIGGQLAGNVAINGSSQQVELPTSLRSTFTNVDNFTLAGWIKVASVSQAQSLFRFQPASTDYLVFPYNASGTAKSIIKGDGDVAGGLTLSGTWTDAAWHHIALTRQRNTTNGLKFYVDGALQAQQNAGNVAALASGGTSFPYMIGCYPGSYPTTAGYSERFNGSCDDLRVYNRALAAADVSALYDLGKPQNTVAPGFTGTTQVGQTLTGTSGTWTDGSVNARKWQSADDGSGTGAADISGETSSTYAIGFTEASKYIRYGVQYSNSIGTTWAYSAWSGPVTAGSSSGGGAIVVAPSRAATIARNPTYSPTR